MVDRHELTDEQWAILEPLLPPLNTGRGRKMHDRRTIINAVLWLVKTGIPWRDLPEKYGKWNSIYKRFSLWQTDGTWELILDALMAMFEAEEAIDWKLCSIDGTIVRAHKASAGASKKNCRKASPKTMRSVVLAAAHRRKSSASATET